MAKSKTSKQKQESLLNAQRAFFTTWTIIGCLALIVVLAQILNILSTPVAIVAWTVVIIFCLRGMVNSFEEHGLGRLAGTTLAYVIMFLVIGLIVLIMSSPVLGVGDQFASLVASIPSLITDLTNWFNQTYAQYASFLDNETVRSYVQDMLKTMGSAAQDFARSGATSMVALGSGIANLLTVLMFALVVAFWILLELPDIGREANRLISDKYKDDAQMLHVTFTRVMGGYIRATILQCAIIGVACGILFTILGIPNSVALGVITGLLNIIPIVGPWLGGALAGAMGLLASPFIAVAAVVGAVIIQQFVYTFISPRFMADAVDIHPALTLVVMMVGSSLGGAMGGLVGSLVGMLVSIPATAVIKSIFVYYFEKRTGRQLVSEDGVFFQGTPSKGEGVDPIADATSLHPDATARIDKIEARRAERATADATGAIPNIFMMVGGSKKGAAVADDEEACAEAEAEADSVTQSSFSEEMMCAVEAAEAREAAEAAEAKEVAEAAAAPEATAADPAQTGELPQVTEALPPIESTTRGLDRVVIDEES